MEPGTDWNKHKGVGQTLLHNWVEERSVGNKVLYDREHPKVLARSGHKNILEEEGPQFVKKSTNASDYASPSLHPTSSGANRSIKETEWLRQAIQETEEASRKAAQSDNNGNPWASIYKCAFSHSKAPEELHANLPSEKEVGAFESPISFWTDFATKGSGTAICSLDAKAVQLAAHQDIQKNDPSIVGHKAIQAYEFESAANPGIRFGKNTAFSTPIDFNLKTSHK